MEGEVERQGRGSRVRTRREENDAGGSGKELGGGGREQQLQVGHAAERDRGRESVAEPGGQQGQGRCKVLREPRRGERGQVRGPASERGRQIRWVRQHARAEEGGELAQA